VERIIDEFRIGSISSFKATVDIIEELEKWSGNVSDEERGHALQTYLEELRSNVYGARGGGSIPDRAHRESDKATFGATDQTHLRSKENPRGS
jgi:hypothetical protein